LARKTNLGHSGFRRNGTRTRHVQKFSQGEACTWLAGQRQLHALSDGVGAKLIDCCPGEAERDFLPAPFQPDDP
jgi:hypothetical protein